MTAKQNKQLPLLTAGELVRLAKTQPPPLWIVQDLFRLSRGRISLMLGQPEDGKSTLGRQLCVDVAKGRDFLGKKCMRAPVLAWVTEDSEWDLGDWLGRLGYDEGKDEPIYVLDPKKHIENPIQTTVDILDEHPEIKLVMFETLDDYLRVASLLDNTFTREKFDYFNEHVMSKYSDRTAFVALHHLRKNEADKSGQMILGASVIRGKTDNKLYIRVVGDDDNRHYVFSQTRRGDKIPKTFLNFDPETEISTLGNTWAEEMKNSAVQTEDRILRDMIEFFTNNPESPKEACIKTVVVTRWSFCTKASERVYITAEGCEIEFGGTRRL